MSLTDKIKSLYGGRTYDPATGTISGISSGGTGLFGTFSKQDEALFNRQMAEAQTLADIAIMEYQNEYNDPAEQAKRMRMAGLNPDLHGVDSNQSADASAAGAVSPVGSNPTEVLSNVASTAFQAFNAAQSIISGVMSFRAGIENVTAQRLNNIDKMDDFAISYLLGAGLTPRSFDNGLISDDLALDLISSSRDWSRKVYGFNRKEARLFEDSVMRKTRDPQFNKSFYEVLNGAESERQDFLGKTTGDLYHDQDNTMRIILDEVIRMNNSVYKAQLRASKQQFDYQEELYDNLSGSSFAHYQNMLNVNETANIRSEYYQNAFNNNIRKRLYKSYENGNMFSGFVLSTMSDLSATGLKPLNFGPNGINNALNFVNQL